MKNTIKYIGLALVAGLALLATAAGYYSGSAPQPAVNSAAGGTATLTQATNGLYTAAISGASSAITWETNLVKLTTAVQGNELAIAVTAQGSTATGCTNFYVLLSTVPKGTIVNITNSAALGQASSAAQRSTYWWTNTIALNGTSVVSTNILLTPYSTPAYSGDLDVYVEQIGYLGTNTTYVTNYTIVPQGVQ